MEESPNPCRLSYSRAEERIVVIRSTMRRAHDDGHFLCFGESKLFVVTAGSLAFLKTLAKLKSHFSLARVFVQ
jgi:hypothetical protein